MRQRKFQRNCPPRLPYSTKPKHNVSTELRKYGFEENLRTRHSYSNGSIIIQERREYRTTGTHWRYYTNYNKNEYIQFKTAEEVVNYVSTIYTKVA